MNCVSWWLILPYTRGVGHKKIPEVAIECFQWAVTFFGSFKIKVILLSPLQYSNLSGMQSNLARVWIWAISCTILFSAIHPSAILSETRDLPGVALVMTFFTTLFTKSYKNFRDYRVLPMISIASCVVSVSFPLCIAICKIWFHVIIQ